MPVLDTSFLVDLDADVESALRAMRLLEKDELLLPFQAACEFLAGMEDPVAELSGLERSYSLVVPNQSHLLEVARLAKVARGRPQWGDIHIAAVAHLASTYVVTGNPKDFKALGCRVWDYRHEPKTPEESKTKRP